MRAQLLSVDINGASSQASQSTAPGFVAWNMGSQTGANAHSATQYFTNYTYTYDPNTGLPTSTNISLIIPCTVAMTYPTAASSMNYLFAKNANKNGYSTSPDPSVGWRLSIDGCMSYLFNSSVTPNIDQPNTNGGAISLTLLNLPAGVHSITTYHNDPWGPAGASWHTGITNISRCIISANGVPVFTNIPTIVCTNDSKCGFAFFFVTNSYDGQPVVLNFNPDHSSVLDFTILNGFEIDRPSAPGTTATAINPTPGNEHVFANYDVPLPGAANSGYLSLQWQPAAFAISNYLYFGTNSQTECDHGFQCVHGRVGGGCGRHEQFQCDEPKQHVDLLLAGGSIGCRQRNDQSGARQRLGIPHAASGISGGGRLRPMGTRRAWRRGH